MTKRKPTIFDLMIITGVTLVLLAIPMGIVFALESQPIIQADWHWQVISGIVMTVALIFIGGVLFWIGETTLERRLKTKDKVTPRDMA